MGKKKCTFWADFKEFAVKGNFIDMAIGVVVGGAFGKIVTSLVNDIIMPLIGWLVGGVDLTSLKVELKGNLVGKVAEGVEPAYLNYGNFIQEIIDFLIIALCIFLCVRLITRLGKKAREKKAAEEAAAAAAAAPAPKPEDVALLEEIRDLLKEKK